jgi:hypothetical protein
VKLHRRLALIAVFACAGILLNAAPLAPIHEKCRIGLSQDPGKFSLHLDDGDCTAERHCGSNYSDEFINRFTGITVADLAREGAQLTAALTAEAGNFTCAGTVHDRVLSGDSVFTPNAAFVDRMQQLGFTGFDSEKLQAYAFVNVDSAYVRSLQQTGIHGITIDNLIALRIFNIDPAYIDSITALGFEKPDAGKLIALRVQGVNAEEVRQIRALGYQPSLDEMIQIRIFHITPDFIHRMQDRGFKNLTISKLVQIRIFNLAE